MKSKMLPNEDHTFIDSLISTLKTQLKKLMENALKNNQIVSFEEKARNGAHEVFLYYSKLMNTIGNSGTVFTKKKFEFINLSKFLQFSKDFGILEEKNSNKYKAKTENFEKIFEKNSDPKKQMYEYQFFSALENVSLIFFDEEYDFFNKTH